MVALARKQIVCRGKVALRRHGNIASSSEMLCWIANR